MIYRNILVTGGAGAIGFNLTRELLRLGYKRIIIIDNLSSGHIENIPIDPKVSFIKGNIEDDRILNKAFRHKPDVVVHLAAHFANQNSVEHPVQDLTSNGIGTLKLLELSREFGVKKFIYFSTSCVYKNKDKKLRESDLDLQFETPYAISKYIGEKYVNFYNKFYGLPTVILRIFNSFGPGERGGIYRNVIPNFFHRALTNQNIIITGTGEESRNFTFVGDIVEGTLLALNSEKAIGKTINIGSSRKIKIKHLARAVQNLTGHKGEIIFKPRRSWDNSLSRDGDLTLARKVLGFRATTPFRVGLAKTAKWYKSELVEK